MLAQMTDRWPNDAPVWFQVAYVAVMTTLIVSGMAGLICLVLNPH